MKTRDLNRQDLRAMDVDALAALVRILDGRTRRDVDLMQRARAEIRRKNKEPSKCPTD